MSHLNCFTYLSLISPGLFLILSCADQEAWTDERQTISKSTTASAGDPCNAQSECIWSSFAVSRGIQAAEIACGDQLCACVQEGDVSISCAAKSPKSDHRISDGRDRYAGGSCGDGCIWSTYSVSIGAQGASALCDGQPCACVEQGDAWSKCGDETTSDRGVTSNEPPQGMSRMPDVPYFYQYDNNLYPGASCQNTSIAMVLSYLGWRGTPDEITRRYGKDWAQSPAGLAALFNLYVDREGLSMRIQPTTAGTLSGLRAELDRGHPVIIHGYFTSYGHVAVVLGYDDYGYYLNDPAGRWSEYFKGGYSGGGSGRGVYYSKASFEAAVATSDGYSSLPMWYHALR